MVPGSLSSRPLRTVDGRLWDRTSVFQLSLVFIIQAALIGRTKGLTFTLASDDGSYYPYLDYLLQSPNLSYVVSSAQELQALPSFNSTTHSFPVIGKRAVVGESFFSVFSSAQVKLWEVENGTAIVPAFFDVREGAELLLVGFNLNWAARPISSHPLAVVNSASSKYPALQTLLERLQLYVELSGTGKLQLLHTVIEGLTCDGLHRLYDGLNMLRGQPQLLAALSRGVVPFFRYVYPYLVIKYAQLGPIWVEDLTLSCAAQANLSLEACPLQPPTVYNITSHDDIITALRAVEKTDVMTCVTHRTVLRLVENVTLDVSRWRSDGGMFITSNVTFECADREQFLLDFSGGLNLFKVRAAAYVQIVNLVVTNLPLAPVGIFTVPIWSFDFERKLILQTESRLHMVNTTGVVPIDEFVYLQYWTTILTNPTQAIASLAAWQGLIQRMELTAMSPDTLRFARIGGMGLTGDNIVLTSRTYGVDLLVPKTGVDQLLGTDFRAGPPYTIPIYTAAQLKRVLTVPDARISRLAVQDGLTNGNSTNVLLLLQNNVTIEPDLWPPGVSFPVRRRISVQGRPFHDVFLDFGFKAPLLTATGNGMVHFKFLKLLNAGWLANYTSETALQQRPPLDFLQTGMWPVAFERTGLPRVSLSSVTLLVSQAELDILFACQESYGTNDTAAAPLPVGLDPESCGQLFPRDTQVSNVSREAGLIWVTDMHLSSFDANDVLLTVDEGLDRPDLLQLLQGAFPTTLAQSSGSYSSGPNVAAIVGGAVGGAVACVLLAAAVLLYTSRRNRRRQQEKHLRGLQAKQASQLGALRKTNPLAQLILDHLAGKDPGVAQLVLAGNAGPAPSATVDITDTGCTGSTSTGVGGVAGVATGSSGGGGGADSGCGGGAGSGGDVAGESGSIVAVEDAKEQRQQLPATSMPVNIAASDLAELFKHLTILGVANMSSTADGLGPDSRSSRTRHSHAGSAYSHGGRGKASGMQPLSRISGFTQALTQRLHFRTSTTGMSSRERDGSNPRDADDAEAASSNHKRLGQDSGDTAVPSDKIVGIAAQAGGSPVAGAGKQVTGGAGPGGAGGSDGGGGAPGADAGGSGAAGTSGDADNMVLAPLLPEALQDHLIQSPVLEELLRLSLDLAGEIDDNQLIVTEVVASGGFGTVYKGMWHNLPVAVKIVLFSTASVNRRIALQEAALSKSISHPNIIATYAVDAKPMSVLGRAGTNNPASSHPNTGPKSRSMAEIQEWRLYIIQEFADGGTLRRALDKGAFHEPQTGLPRMEMLLDIAQGVAAAVAHLHSKNVVHGDLNPKNVLLKVAPMPAGFPSASNGRSAAAGGMGKHGGGWPSGAVHPAKPQQHPHAPVAAAMGATQYGSYLLAGRCGFAVKVADFGLSVKMENSHISGLRQGTPFYAAPELAQLGIFSRAADTYAFGVLLWELYWGRPIWVPDSRAAGGYVQHEDFPLLPYDCPPDYAALLADCLQLNHLQRPCFEEVQMRLRLVAHAVLYVQAPTPVLTSGTLGILDSSMSISMPGLPAAMHTSHGQPQTQAQAHAQAQAQAYTQAQADTLRNATGAAAIAQQQRLSGMGAQLAEGKAGATRSTQPVPVPSAAALQHQQYQTRGAGAPQAAAAALLGRGARAEAEAATHGAAAHGAAAHGAAAQGRSMSQRGSMEATNATIAMAAAAAKTRTASAPNMSAVVPAAAAAVVTADADAAPAAGAKLEPRGGGAVGAATTEAELTQNAAQTAADAGTADVEKAAPPADVPCASYCQGGATSAVHAGSAVVRTGGAGGSMSGSACIGGSGAQGYEGISSGATVAGLSSPLNAGVVFAGMHADQDSGDGQHGEHAGNGHAGKAVSVAAVGGVAGDVDDLMHLVQAGGAGGLAAAGGGVAQPSRISTTNHAAMTTAGLEAIMEEPEEVEEARRT